MPSFFPYRLRFFGFAFLAFLVTGSAVHAEPERTVVVVANRNVPESVALARYYMKQRNIPAQNLCVLDLPEGDDISRVNYVKRLRDPLLAFMRDREFIEQEARPAGEVVSHQTGWITLASSVDYVVSIYGVPLRIADTRMRVAARLADRLGRPALKNEAAVDSELALMLMPPYDITGPFPNPLQNSMGFGRVFGDNRFMIVAARLDGPDPASVRAQIDGALFAERYGLLGRAYFDARGIQVGGYFAGDYWIREAYERFLREGYECVLDVGEAVWSTGFPMEHAVVYFGWYQEHVTGPFTREDFRFQPGAIAYHIHSASALTLRSRDRQWTGPLLARGAAASMGAVGEPFLQFTPDLKRFAERICEGYPFGDAAYIAQSMLSWQMTFVGDPLYRPFRYSLTEQIRHLEEDERPEVEWAYLRRINQLVRDGRFNVALALCRAQLQKQDSLVLREKLGDLYLMNELPLDAARQYEQVMLRAQTAETAVRVGLRLISALRAIGRTEGAEKAHAHVQEKWAGHVSVDWLERVLAERAQ